MNKFHVIVDTTHLLDSLKQIELRSHNLIPVLEDIGKQVLESTLTRYERETDPVGKKWAPLSPKYRAWKEKEYPGKQILVRTETLRNSISSNVSGNSVAIGTNIPYAGGHQFGNASRRLPARPFLGFTTQDLDETTKAVHKYLMNS